MNCDVYPVLVDKYTLNGIKESGLHTDFCMACIPIPTDTIELTLSCTVLIERVGDHENSTAIMGVDLTYGKEELEQMVKLAERTFKMAGADISAHEDILDVLVPLPVDAAAATINVRLTNERKTHAWLGPDDMRAAICVAEDILGGSILKGAKSGEDFRKQMHHLTTGILSDFGLIKSRNC